MRKDKYTLCMHVYDLSIKGCWVAERSKAPGENLEEGGGPGLNPAAVSWSAGHFSP